MQEVSGAPIPSTIFAQKVKFGADYFMIQAPCSTQVSMSNVGLMQAYQQRPKLDVHSPAPKWCSGSETRTPPSAHSARGGSVYRGVVPPRRAGPGAVRAGEEGLIGEGAERESAIQSQCGPTTLA